MNQYGQVGVFTIAASLGYLFGSLGLCVVAGIFQWPRDYSWTPIPFGVGLAFLSAGTYGIVSWWRKSR